MTRTIALVTAARAKGVELPGEWFYRHSPKCPKGHDIPSGRNFSSHPYRCNTCEVHLRDMDVEWDEACCAPDLELPENLHAAFRFADALNEAGPVEITRSGINEVYRFRVRVIVKGEYGKLILHEHTAPERHLALVAACEAALGIQHGKESAA